MEEYGSLLRGGVPSRTEERFQYADFAVWQSQRISGGAAANSVAYWKQRLQNLPDLRFPFELTSGKLARQPKRVPVEFSDVGLDSLQQCSNKENVTVFMLLIAVFQLLLHRLSGQEEVVTAFPVHGRTLAACKNLIGFFAYPILLRSNCSGDPSFRQLLSRVRAEVLEAMHHEDLPFAKIVGLATTKNPRAPLFRTLFSYVQSELSGLEAGGVVLDPTSLAIGTGDCDLALTVCVVGGLSSAELAYNASFFDGQTAQWIASSYLGLLKQCITSPSARLSEFRVLGRPPESTVEGKLKDTHIRIMATFTAEPLLESLTFWTEQIGVSARIEFAPHNQIFQQLLLKTEEANYLKSFNVILIRLQDWQGSSGDVHDPIRRLAAFTQIEKNLQDFLITLEKSVQRGSQHLVIFCSGSTDLVGDPVLVEKEEATLKALASIDGMRAVGSNAIFARYPVASYYDQRSDREARIPYTETFFAALGTVIAREIYSVAGVPKKVIAVDCDGTLWDGLCGEDGPEGVVLTPSARALQEFLVAQHAAGMLICVCSKNEEKDVLQTLTSRTDMPLRPEHIIAARVNWRSKRENLVALSQELNLGLETFILIDDDEMQCAEVNAILPQVLTVTMSHDLSQTLAKLRHVWNFDKCIATPAARRRTELYKQEFERQRARNISHSLREFLESLDLRVRIAPTGPASIQRMSELTCRTTQFNVSGIRRSSNQITQGITSGDFECLTVQVQDRFGDYGEVGVIVYRVDGMAFNVDTFLLSCRALGRGVEHKMLAHLAAIGQQRGLEEVRIHYLPSDRNKPALEFLEEANRRLSHGEGGPVYRFPIASAMLFSYDPEDQAQKLGESRTPHQEDPHSQLPSSWNINTLARTTCEFSDPILLTQELRRRRVLQQAHDCGGSYVAPRNPIEAKLASMWCETLGLDRVGVEDDFFALGGNSVVATQVLSRVWNEFGVEVPLAELFEGDFSVARLARQVDACRVQQASADELERHLSAIETMSDDEVNLRLKRERSFESHQDTPPSGYRVTQ
jgi:FkbH-like protein